MFLVRWRNQEFILYIGIGGSRRECVREPLGRGYFFKIIDPQKQPLLLEESEALRLQEEGCDQARLWSCPQHSKFFFAILYLTTFYLTHHFSISADHASPLHT